MAREFPFEIPLRTGLRPNTRVQRGHFETLKNLRPTEQGLTAPEPIVELVSGNTLTWPWPQLRKGQYSLFQLGTTIYEVDEDDGSTTSRITGLDNNLTDWHFAQIYNAWIATDGSQCVYSGFGDRASATQSTSMYPLSVCYAAGRLVFGGSTSLSTSIKDTWKLTTTHYTKDSVLTEPRAVMFSEPLGGDIDWPFSVFLRMLGLDTSASTIDEHVVLESLRTGKIDIVPLPSSSPILAVRTMGNRVAAYTSDSIFMVSPDMPEPERILHRGLLGRGAVTGDNDTHIFITKDYQLWRLSLNGQLTRLDFSEHLSSLTGTVVSSYDEIEGEAYFSDGSRTFVLRGDFLFEITRTVTSLVRLNDENLYGIAEDISNSNAVELLTTPSDLEFSGLKSIRYLELLGHGIDVLRMKVHYRYDQEASYTEADWRYCSPEAVTWIGVQARDFKFGLRGYLSTPLLETLRARFSYTDDRTVRGPRGTRAEQV